MEAYKLKEVQDYIKQVIALNFEDSIWIDAEISQVKEVRGQVYLEFVEKNENSQQIKAKAQGVIWYKTQLFISKKLGELYESILQDGRQIRFKAKIEFHEVYGLKFNIEDIEPSYTMGMVEINRQKTIAKLKKEGLLYKNRETVLPKVIKRVAVISSQKAAGLQDFYQHLNNNPYGYKFAVSLYDSSMQGSNVERDIVRNLNIIREGDSSFDCVVIIRGGGSKMDLSYFDNYNICANVAKFPIPVLTGIGHDIDQNVIELVAHSPLKTPTAVADFLVDNNLDFEMQLNQIHQSIVEQINYKMLSQKNALESLSNRIKTKIVLAISDSHNNLENKYTEIKNQVVNIFIREKNKINEIETIVNYSNPKNILAKGYSLITKNRKIVKSIKDISKNDIVKTMLQDGEFESTVM